MSEKEPFYFAKEIEKGEKIQGRTRIEILPERAVDLLSGVIKKEDALGLIELLCTNFDWAKLCKDKEIRELIELATQTFGEKLRKNNLPPGDPDRIKLTEGQVDECSSVLIPLRSCIKRYFPADTAEA